MWLCPFRIFKEDTGLIHPTKEGEEYFIDIGTYGKPQSKNFHYINSLKKCEDYVLSAQGY